MAKHRPFSTTFFAVLGLVCLLAACDFFAPKTAPTAKPAKSAKPRYSTADYTQQLALAQLGAADGKEAADIVNAYAARKAKSERQLLLVFDYQAKTDAAMHKIATPITLTPKQEDFSHLLNIMPTLSGSGYTLHNLSILAARLTPDKSLKISEKTSDDDVQAALRQQHERLLAQASPVPLRDTIDTELRLIRFFIDHRFRDAAYLATDNVKQGMAKLTSSGTANPAELQRFTQALEILESDMRKTMPFSL